MATLPKYPFTRAQKLDVFLFADEAERLNIEKLNKLNQELHELSSDDYHEPYGKPVPQGVMERFEIGTYPSTNKFEDELLSIERQIKYISEKRNLEIIQSDPTLYAEYIRDQYMKKNPANPEHVATLAKIWPSQFIKVTEIKKGTALYSGQTSRSDMVFDQTSNHEATGLGMWLSSSIDDALSYATKEGEHRLGKQLFAFEVKESFKVIELNPAYHPGLRDPNADRQHLDRYLSSHSTMAYGFDDIIAPLIQSELATDDVIGHLRFKADDPTHINEIWIKSPNPNLLRATDTFILPRDRAEFEKTLPKFTYSKAGEDKSLQLLKHFSAGDMEAWSALSFKAKRVEKGDYPNLKSLLRDCGFKALDSHMKSVIKHSGNDVLVELLVGYEAQRMKNNLQNDTQAPKPQPTPSQSNDEITPKNKR